MISKNISYKEAVFSATANRIGIENKPNKEQLKCMKAIAENVFEPLRKHFNNKPIRVSSFFRNEATNKAIKGSKTSQHVKGQAMDLIAIDGSTNAEMYYYIRDNLEFDQLIWEYGNEIECAWVHVSFRENIYNRKQTLLIK